MKQFTARIALVCAIATAALAQAPVAGPREGGEGRGGRGGPFSRLNLTAAQQEQARSIFDARDQAAQPVREQLQQAETALYDAARRNAGDAELDRLAQAEAPLLVQLEAIRAKAFARFYQILTPEQRQILDSAPDRGQGGAGRMRFGGRPLR